MWNITNRKPVYGVFAVIVVLTLSLAFAMQNIASFTEKDCFKKIVETATQSSKTFSKELKSTLEELNTFGGIVVGDHAVSDDAVKKVIEHFCSNRNFSGVEIISADGSKAFGGTLPKNKIQSKDFYKEAAELPRIYGKIVDGDSRKQQYICFGVPIKRNQKVAAIVYGYMPLEEVSAFATTDLYGGKCQIVVLDGDTGDFLVDEHHRYDKDGNELPLMNLDTMNARKTKDGYSWDTMRKQIKKGKAGHWIFISEKTKENYYSNYVPTGINNWSMMITIDEPTAFTSYYNVKRVMMILLLISIICLILIVNLLSVQYARSKQVLRKVAADANAASQAKTDFLSRMSHDIRTPINGIVGMVHMMEHRIDDKEVVEEGLEKVTVLSHQLELLINDVLEMGRIESGKIELSAEPFNLKEVLHEIAPSIKSLAESRDVLLTGAHYDIQHTNVIGSPIHIQRIFMNIFSNAIKYNHPRGSVECWAKETPVDETHSAYTFIIKDTGMGMSKEFLEHIFEPFTRETERMDSSQTGTGLGMAITKELVDKMGGTIEIQSKEGVGTTFIVRLTLPLCEDVSTETKEECAISIDGIHVLLVDDSQINREVATFMLTEENAIVDTATNGKEAVEKFSRQEQNTYDVILMDVMMPEMDGLEATRAIRALDRKDAASIPIIAMTANAFADDVKACLQAGMSDHLAKPVSPESVVAKVTKWVSIKNEGD